MDSSSNMQEFLLRQYYIVISKQHRNLFPMSEERHSNKRKILFSQHYLFNFTKVLQRNCYDY